MPSVTHITRFLSVDVASNARPWMRDAAANRGTMVHSYCADIDYGAEPESIDLDCIGYVQAYKNFLRDYRIKSWLAVELPLGSAAHGYAGTLDRCGYVDGAITIVDLKTGSKINRASLTAQLNGYRALWLEHMPKLVPFRLLGIQLKKDGKYRPYQCDIDPALFNHCYALNKALEEIK